MPIYPFLKFVYEILRVYVIILNGCRNRIKPFAASIGKDPLENTIDDEIIGPNLHNN